MVERPDGKIGFRTEVGNRNWVSRIQRAALVAGTGLALVMTQGACSDEGPARPDASTDAVLVPPSEAGPALTEAGEPPTDGFSIEAQLGAVGLRPVDNNEGLGDELAQLFPAQEFSDDINYYSGYGNVKPYTTEPLVIIVSVDPRKDQLVAVQSITKEGDTITCISSVVKRHVQAIMHLVFRARDILPTEESEMGILLPVSLEMTGDIDHITYRVGGTCTRTESEVQVINSPAPPAA